MEEGGRAELLASLSDPVCSDDQPPTAQLLERKGVRFLETYIQTLLPLLYYTCSMLTVHGTLTLSAFNID